MAFGCSIAPRNFRGMTHPAAITRARSVALGQGLPESQVVPTLIGKLDDPDPVVRLTAHQELRRRSGQDFGYLPWAPSGERGQAIAKYRAWWDQRRAALARTPQKP
jgi:hypothetical protein